MAQQINLYSPILLTPKRHFSALAMLQSLSVLALALLALCLWTVFTSQRLQHEMGDTARHDADERHQLEAALAQRAKAPKDSTALEQELTQARQALAARQALLVELARADDDHARGRAAMLQLLAQTVPAPVWLTEVRLGDGRLELSGMTLQPESLRPWLTRLAAEPALAGQALAAVKVERSDAATGAEVWSFRVVSRRAAGVAS